ncbi:hypothetical protein BpHYR1_042910 [Brachionus plicatilis]|uniref:Uncharacterized protein n=1 Tax=Brachionus plicatilis TaxID=10195 RepID=A0A3M7T4S5_BRAPC|nr:hypothetical protein BpHYR1_042910 [Brachionus plicatilis]
MKISFYELIKYEILIGNCIKNQLSPDSENCKVFCGFSINTESYLFYKIIWNVLYILEIKLDFCQDFYFPRKLTPTNHH